MVEQAARGLLAAHQRIFRDRHFAFDIEMNEIRERALLAVRPADRQYRKRPVAGIEGNSGFSLADDHRPRAGVEKRLVKHVPTLGIEPRVSHRNFAACEGAHRNLAKARKRIARRNEQAHRARIEDQRLQTGKFARLTNERDIDQPLLQLRNQPCTVIAHDIDRDARVPGLIGLDRKLSRWNPESVGIDAEDKRLAVRSEEHTSELQSLMRISYAV